MPNPRPLFTCVIPFLKETFICYIICDYIIKPYGVRVRVLGALISINITSPAPLLLQQIQDCFQGCSFLFAYRRAAKTRGPTMYGDLGIKLVETAPSFSLSLILIFPRCFFYVLLSILKSTPFMNIPAHLYSLYHHFFYFFCYF